VCVQLADRHYIVEQGVIVHEAGNAAFMADHDVKDRYLGVGLA
jgi:branched-chain amino acid transport system ATP-binding protein